MTATPTPLRELPAKLRAEAAGKTDTAYEVGRVAEKLRCAHLIEAALSARDEAGAVVCGACGKEWDGQKCGQAENGWPFPVCYPIATPPAASGDDPVAEIMADWSLRWQAGHAARPGDKLYTRRLAAVAPAGMVPVPREPTPALLRKFLGNVDMDDAARSYAAMLAAAPTPLATAGKE